MTHATNAATYALWASRVEKAVTAGGVEFGPQTEASMLAGLLQPVGGA